MSVFQLHSPEGAVSSWNLPETFQKPPARAARELYVHPAGTGFRSVWAPGHPPEGHPALAETLLPAQGPESPWELCVQGHPSPSDPSPGWAAPLNAGGISSPSGESQFSEHA